MSWKTEEIYKIKIEKTLFLSQKQVEDCIRPHIEPSMPSGFNKISAIRDLREAFDEAYGERLSLRDAKELIEHVAPQMEELESAAKIKLRPRHLPSFAHGNYIDVQIDDAFPEIEAGRARLYYDEQAEDWWFVGNGRRHYLNRLVGLDDDEEPYFVGIFLDN